MNSIFEMVNALFAGVVPVADFLWDFPTNFEWYASIPILGRFSLAILLLLGGSFYFTFKFGFVQIKEFGTGIRLLTSKTKAKVGETQLAAFLMSMAGRVGAGNIVGVTGAVTIGGPGAIFWKCQSVPGEDKKEEQRNGEFMGRPVRKGDGRAGETVQRLHRI